MNKVKQEKQSEEKVIRTCANCAYLGEGENGEKAFCYSVAQGKTPHEIEHTEWHCAFWVMTGPGCETLISAAKLVFAEREAKRIAHNEPKAK